MRLKAFFFCFLCFFLNISFVKADHQPYLVFAAASLEDALKPIGKLFEEETGKKVRFSFAASSTLARQIASGAPADIYISADIEWAVWLKTQNLVAPQTQKIIAQNRLVLAAPKQSPYNSSLTVSEILKDWKLNTTDKLALADPDHVPAGRYARSALKSLEADIGKYDDLSNRFAIASNVRLAALLIARAEVPLGIIYHSDVSKDDRLKEISAFASTSHAHIVYPAVRLMGGRDGAQKFMTFLETPNAQKFLKDAGLILPRQGL